METKTVQQDIPDIVRLTHPNTPLIRSASVSGLPDRYWAKVTKTDDCWLWDASLNNYGYGQFFFDGKARKAHRLSYEWAYGPIPEGLEIDHLCKVRHCVRPEHLEAVSHQTNLLRGDTFQASNAAKTHCLRGHAFDEENTYWLPNGGRQCKPCWRIRANEGNARRRANRT